MVEQSQQMILFFSHEEGNDNNQSRTLLKKHKEVTQATKRTMYVTDNMAYTYTFV
jgi:hypothetical protein